MENTSYVVGWVGFVCLPTWLWLMSSQWRERGRKAQSNHCSRLEEMLSQCRVPRPDTSLYRTVESEAGD